MYIYVSVYVSEFGMFDTQVMVWMAKLIDDMKKIYRIASITYI